MTIFSLQQPVPPVPPVPPHEVTVGGSLEGWDAVILIAAVMITVGVLLWPLIRAIARRIEAGAAVAEARGRAGRAARSRPPAGGGQSATGGDGGAAGLRRAPPRPAGARPAQAVDEVRMHELTNADVVVLVAFAIGAMKVFTGPIGAAIGDRLRAAVGTATWTGCRHD